MKTYLSEFIKKNGFVNGIYQPWFHADWYGRDIGSSVLYNYKDCCFNKNYIRKQFENCKAIGFDMIKLWLNEAEEGLYFDDNGSVIAVEPQLYKNLGTIFEMADEIGIMVGICLNDHSECAYSDDKSMYDKRMRYKQVAEETEKYVENWVKPIIELASKYKCVTLVDIFAEPEAEGRFWDVSRGVHWNVLVKFINRVSRAVKEINPRLATTVSSGCNTGPLVGGSYCAFEVDYVGGDIYTDTGFFADPAEFFCTKPFMLGEYGLSSYATANDDDQVQVVKNFYKRIEETNAAGSFYWSYGWGVKRAGEYHLIDENSELRTAAAYIHFYQIDRYNKLNGTTGYDKPCLLGHYNSKRIDWLGTRGAMGYVIESSADGVKFEQIGEMLSMGEERGYPDILKFENPTPDDEKLYRVVAIMPNGEKITSEPVAMIGEM